MLASIVRDYWEGFGFFVRELPVRESATAKKSTLPVQWIEVSHSDPESSPGEPGLQWFGRDIRRCGRAVLVVPDWMGGRASSVPFGHAAKLSTYLEKTFLKSLSLPTSADCGGLPVVLLVPAVPMSEPHRSKMTKVFHDAGVEAVVSFRTIMLDLCQQLDAFPALKSSGLGQCLELLKAYDLLNVRQLELFNG